MESSRILESSRTTHKQKRRRHRVAILALTVMLIVGSGTGSVVESSSSLSDGANGARSRDRRHADTMQIETFTLDNGLEVVAIPIFGLGGITYDNGIQIITLPPAESSSALYMVWYKVGAADDPAGKSGLAHFVEHATVRAVGSHTEKEMSPPTPYDNAESGAFTSYDYTAYMHVVSMQRQETAMQTEAKRMANLVMTNEILAPERSEIHNEWHQQVNDIPQVSFDEEMRAALYGTHPYGVPVLGRFRQIQRLSKDDVNHFYQTWYAPNNAVLIVASSHTAAQLKPLVQRYFGSISAHPTPIRHRPPVPDRHEAQRLVINDARVCKALWKRMYLAPSYQAGNTEQVYALQVLAEVLAGKSTGRLFHHVITKKGLATDIGIDYMPDSLGLTTFTVYAIPASDVAVDILEQTIDKELASVVHSGVSRADVMRAQQHMQSEMAFVPEQLSEVVEKLGAALTTRRTLTDMAEWQNHIAAVTQDQVQEAAETVLRAERSVTGILLPASDGNVACVGELETESR